MMVGQGRAMCYTIGCAVRPAASTLLESESERQARAYLPESESGSSTFCSLLVGTLVFHHQQNNTYSFQNKITFYRGQLRCDSTQCRFPPCPLDHLLVVPETRFVQKKMLDVTMKNMILIQLFQDFGLKREHQTQRCFT